MKTCPFSSQEVPGCVHLSSQEVSGRRWRRVRVFTITSQGIHYQKSGYKLIIQVHTIMTSYRSEDYKEEDVDVVCTQVVRDGGSLSVRGRSST